MSQPLTGQLDRSSPLPLWAQVLEELRRHIDEDPTLERLPTEGEICAAFDVSRNTVREALRHLRAEGLIDSKRGLGTTINRARFEQRYGTLHSLFRTIEEQGARHRNDVLEIKERPNASVARILQVAPTDPLVYVERLQLADQVPLALDRSWIPSRLADGLADLDLSDRGLYNELAERFGLTPDAASERIHALLPGRKERDLLRLPTDTAAFQIDRWATMNGRPIVFSHTLVRGDLYSLLIEWRGQSMTDVELTNGLAPFVP